MGEPKVKVGIRIPKALHQRLRAVADEREVSMDKLVTWTVQEHLKHLPPLPWEEADG